MLPALSPTSMENANVPDHPSLRSRHESYGCVLSRVGGDESEQSGGFLGKGPNVYPWKLSARSGHIWI